MLLKGCFRRGLVHGCFSVDCCCTNAIARRKCWLPAWSAMTGIAIGFAQQPQPPSDSISDTSTTDVAGADATQQELHDDYDDYDKFNTTTAIQQQSANNVVSNNMTWWASSCICLGGAFLNALVAVGTEALLKQTLKDEQQKVLYFSINNNSDNNNNNNNRPLPSYYFPMPIPCGPVSLPFCCCSHPYQPWKALVGVTCL